MATINEIEVRVLGSLVEKQLTTPEYYPLTLNALTAACNQKSNRDPVMSLGESEILSAIDSLRDKNLVYLFHGSTSRTVKYKHMLPSVYELDEAGTAVMTLLMLRGPQTAGEIRGRSDRLHEFGSIGEVQEMLDELARRDEPLVIKLERQPGQKESRYAHLLSGPVDPGIQISPASPAGSHGSARSGLEDEVRELREELNKLREEFDKFRSEFG
ncbi:MAG: YceH family protein [Chloracidobacterium sp.]|nr:YceH family protein [Chloracidobacterium sp.]